MVNRRTHRPLRETNCSSLEWYRLLGVGGERRPEMLKAPLLCCTGFRLLAFSLLKRKAKRDSRVHGREMGISRTIFIRLWSNSENEICG
jgi:hypothetical protein